MASKNGAPEVEIRLLRPGTERTNVFLCEFREGRGYLPIRELATKDFNSSVARQAIIDELNARS